MTDEAGDVLATLPDALWPPLLQAVRTAADRLGRAHLPVALQPYALFSPRKLGTGRARAAVAGALATDARLRDVVGEVLAEPLRRAAAEQPVPALVEQFGAPDAAAGLTAHARWEDLARLSGEVAASMPAAVAAPPQVPGAGAADKAQVQSARRERDAARRAQRTAERRAKDLEAQLESAERELAAVREERDAARDRADDERAKLRDRLARLQRRVSDAEAAARADRVRVTWLAGELDRLAATLRDASVPGAQDPEPRATPAAPEPAAVPRRPRAATPGRPSVLPPGLTDQQTAGVLSLLDVPGSALILDGYNVTKDLRGVPGAALADQRAWLVQLVAAVAATRELKATIVFDGDRERTRSGTAARIVRTVFTAEGETADDRIVALVAGLPPEQPLLVVSSDREVQDAVQARGGNVAPSSLFLAAVG